MDDIILVHVKSHKESGVVKTYDRKDGYENCVADLKSLAPQNETRIKVFFESRAHAGHVACFYDQKTYHACLPILEKQAKAARMIVTESVVEGGAE